MQSKNNIKLGILSFLIIGAIACSNSNSNKKEQYYTLKEQIENGLDREQEIRQLVHQNFKKDTFDIKLNKLMTEIDSLNHIYAKKYLTEYGYPSISKNGKKLCDGIFYILQHNDISTMEKYIDQLQKKASIGEASKKHYALMRDRILVEKRQKQIYGTQSAPRKNSKGFITNEYFIWPIQNVEIVDSLRAEMGFNKTVKEIALEMDIEFNPHEQIPNK